MAVLKVHLENKTFFKNGSINFPNYILFLFYVLLVYLPIILLQIFKFLLTNFELRNFLINVFSFHVFISEFPLLYLPPVLLLDLNLEIFLNYFRLLDLIVLNVFYQLFSTGSLFLVQVWDVYFLISFSILKDKKEI